MHDAQPLQLAADRRLLLVAAVGRELEALGRGPVNTPCWQAFPLSAHVDAVVSGVGRANAAAAVAYNLAQRPYAFVLNAGVCGALPESGTRLGEIIAADSSIFCEEGIATPAGFLDMQALGFSLGPFPGNCAPCDEGLLAGLRAVADHTGPIATVATCSGTDEAARAVRARTGALAEAMEGAAVVATALSLGAGAGELRAVSNTTGRREAQSWDLDAAVENLAAALRRLLDLPH